MKIIIIGNVMSKLAFVAQLRLKGIKVFEKDDACDLYGKDTGASDLRPAGAIVVKNSQEVKDVIDAANKSIIPLWPISGGRNFGYGTSLPVDENSFILDLSQLKRVEINIESATAYIEPGVTQTDLYNAIKASGHKFLVPTTGVGPNGNILGNAMDGGYGLTPITDHFDAISVLMGYWGNGESFNHTYQDLDCQDMAARWAPGTGYSFSGLLRQGNFGIVTGAHVQLARAPEATRILVFEWKSHQDFINDQSSLNALVEDIPGIGGIIMMNDSRILSTQIDTPLISPLKGEERDVFLKRLAKERKISSWTAIGTLYGSASAVKGSVSDIRRRLPKCRVWSFTPKAIRLLQKIEATFPKVGFVALRRHLGSLVNTLGTVEGYPIVSFLKIAYALNPNAKKLDVNSHPAKDDCGILWYAPLVPFTKDGVDTYCREMSACLKRHGFDPLLAVTSRDSRVLSGTIPLLFNKDIDSDVARAKECYRDLVSTGLKNGWPPYRIGIDYMDMIACEHDTASAKTQRVLKSVLDPEDIILRGRYDHKIKTIYKEFDSEISLASKQ
jgi:4-cresol dehydrogenase (hydroxylating)